MSSILVIGANGFIGLKLLEKLEIFRTVYTISRSKLDLSKKNQIDEYQFDISKKWSFNKFSDLIIFCATQHQFSKTEVLPIDYVNTNMVGLINSLEYAKTKKPSCFVYFSTMSVYGNPNNKILEEESPINNPDIYGVSKYFAEKILLHYSKYFKVLIIRLPGVVDKIMPTNRPWISTVVQKLRNNLDVEIYNPDTNFNNIIDIDNISNLIQSDQILTSNFKYEIVNLASSKPIKLLDVIKILKKNLKSSSNIIVTIDEKRNSFVIDIKKLKKIFSFYPETTESILKKISEKN